MGYDYEGLKVWQKAHAVTLAVYQATRKWPREELYGLTDQVRRAAVSVEANLAEGSGRTGRAEFRQFASLAAGSAAELHCELRIALDLGYLTPDDHATITATLTEVRKMLSALASKLTATG